MRLEYIDVPDNLKNMYDIVGEKNFIEIINMYGGDILYIPRSISIQRIYRNKEIVRKFNGINVMELSREYGITSNQIRRILRERI